MMKIKKNLSDADMLADWQENPTFETAVHEVEVQPEKPAAGKKKGTAEEFNRSFLAPELEEKVGKALLELKLALYKEGIVEYTLKASCDGKQVLITPVPAKKKDKA